MTPRSGPITRIEIGAENRRAIRELVHIYMCARITAQPVAQRFQHLRRFARVVFMQLDEHLGVVGGVVPLDMVVVDLRVAVPQVREPAAHFRHGVQFVFDEVQRAIGFRQRGAIG
jgi:hypothetical protein